MSAARTTMWRGRMRASQRPGHDGTVSAADDGSACTDRAAGARTVGAAAAAAEFIARRHCAALMQLFP